MSVSENEVARQVNTANLRQWQAVLGPDEWGRALAQEPKRVTCDGCHEAVLLEECFIDADDCVLCQPCALAPYEAEESR